MAVIKANAYGHGMIPVARHLRDADAFAVARLHEALQLRGSGIEQPIVLLARRNERNGAGRCLASTASRLSCTCEEQVAMLDRVRDGDRAHGLAEGSIRA